MKKRLAVAFIVLGLFAIMGTWWLVKFGALVGQHAPSGAASDQSAPQSPSSTTKGPGGLTNGKNAPVQPSRQAELPSKETEMRKGWEKANAQLIQVFGKVVDQDGAPIPGVHVSGGTLLVVSFDRSGQTAAGTETDSDGQFSFTNLHGVRFGLTFSKPGYIYDPKQYLNWWDSYHPDPERPAVFVMWKLAGPESISHLNVHFGAACDGTPLRIDLASGNKVQTGGDLVIQLKRNPVNVVAGHPFDWSVTLSIPNGGVQDLKDAYPFTAPADGYVSEVTIEIPATRPDWSAWLTRPFYFKAPGGRFYGRFVLSITADYQPPPTYVGIDEYYNPAGSRNLETTETNVTTLK